MRITGFGKIDKDLIFYLLTEFLNSSRVGFKVGIGSCIIGYPPLYFFWKTDGTSFFIIFHARLPKAHNYRSFWGLASVFFKFGQSFPQGY